MTAQTIAPVRRAVRLRPLALSDAPRVRRWMADAGLIRFTVVVPGPEHGPLAPYTTAEADQYLDTLVNDRSRRSFAIELHGTHVGNIGIKEWQPGAASAECFIEIGEADARGHGVGASALRQLLVIAFTELGLDEVRLGVFAFNAQAIALYRKLGFVDRGRYGWHWADGRYHEINAMSLERWRFR
ncbi:MAG: GNAT family N-acetyltransferase [Deltaproteobacteria bacterium]|nr:GNAT family N-acetyltransferase [Deltaproteobacteria bacterium]